VNSRKKSRPLILWDPLVASSNSSAAISFPTPFWSQHKSCCYLLFARTEKRKSKPKYTARQSGNEPHKIPHITSRKEALTSTPRRPQITEQEGNRLTGHEWREKVQRREISPTTFTAHLFSAQSLNSHDRTVFGRLNSYARAQNKFRFRALGSTPKSPRAHAKNLPNKIPTKFSNGSSPPRLNHARNRRVNG
jgi:hypothetical protein